MPISPAAAPFSHSYFGRDGRTKVLVHGANFVVAEGGAERLSKRGWRQMPVIG
jgi:hypothetical protein